MGACCSTHIKHKGKCRPEDEDELPEKVEKSHDGDVTGTGHNGAIVRFQSSSPFISMYSRKGKNGINQDAMTVWEVELYGGEGCVLLRCIRRSWSVGSQGCTQCRPQLNGCKENDALVSDGQSCGKNDSGGVNKGSAKDRFSSWEASLIEAFKEADEDFSSRLSVDSYCSGTTAVTIVKQDEHLIISNLGDSRAILCTRDSKNRLFPVQLTVDLKPSIPNEVERIEKCGGQVFAMDEEPNVLRVWNPDEDCPGLAMTRAFGDFCLKNYGVSSVPVVSYRRLTSRDEFVVLATDGVWDVLTNKEVITIVDSVEPQSTAAKVLVDYAVRAWRTRCPGSEIDDCAVVCLFLK